MKKNKLLLLVPFVLLSLDSMAQATYDSPEMLRLKSDTTAMQKYNAKLDQFITEHSAKTYWFPIIESDITDAIVLIKTIQPQLLDTPISRATYRLNDGKAIWVIQNEDYIAIITDTTNWKYRWEHMLQDKMLKP